MDVVVAYLVVLAAAATPWLEVLLVVPAGIVAGLSPVGTVLVGVAGNVATLVPVLLGGDRIRRWWRRRRAGADPADAGDDAAVVVADEPATGGRGRARRLFDRYGVVGLAALGPLLTGIHVAAVVALAAGADRRRALVWMTGGVVAWAVLAAVATVLGLEAFVDPDTLPDLGLD